jgi:hypothetical protein
VAQCEETRILSGRSALIMLILAQTALLYLTASSVAGNGTLYGCSLLCGQSGASTVLPLVATKFGAAVFALPAIIGALCEGWQSAVALATAPCWLAVLAHSRTLLAPYIGLSGGGGRFDPPFWLDPTRLSWLVPSFALFAILGWLGWLTRRALRDELARANSRRYAARFCSPDGPDSPAHFSTRIQQ